MTRVESLDGLRGLAALWVLIGHCMILTGFALPILGTPDLGVDLFILLSGFLMAFQYNVRKEKEDWNVVGTWIKFWIKRFFRISPLYFTLLIVALTVGHSVYADRLVIDGFIGQPPQRPERYTDASLTNFLIHMTYIFGLMPDYAFRTPLPDWSIGLEMQFYAVFPFAVLLTRRVGWLPAAFCLCAAAVAIAFTTKRLGIFFPMPAFLPLKMHVFLAGMLIAAGIGRKGIVYLAPAALLAALPIGGPHDILHVLVRELIVIGFFALVHWRSVAWIDGLSGVLGSALFRWLGEVSFGVYLIHLLILHRVAAWIIEEWATAISDVARFTIAITILVPVTYCIAYATYILIERPGQKLGRNLIAALGRRRQAA